MTGNWKSLAAAGLGNLMIAGVVAAVTRAQCRRATLIAPRAETLRINLDLCCGPVHAPSGQPAEQLTPDDCVAMIRREVDELAPLADHLYGMTELAGHHEEVTEETFVRLDDLRWLLGNYVIKGGRVRRLIQLPDLLTSIDLLDPPGARQPQPALEPFRTSAAELLQRIRDTNAATVDWLLTHRVTIPDPDYLDTNALLGRFNLLDADPTAISADPLYLLTCHIHDFLETVERSGQVEHPVLDVLEAQLSRILATIGSEIVAAQAFNAALISLAGKMRPADAA